MINIGQTLGRFRIVKKVGAGGMGEVYLARDDRLERDIAIKVLSAGAGTNDSSRRRFRKEALALSKLNHPNIAIILDYDTQDGIDYLVMEYIRGTPLSEMIDTGPLNEQVIIPLAVQIALALEEAHSRGVVHRDLKPNNLIVSEKGQIKVLDFGLAKFVQTATHDGVTRSGTNEANMMVGTMAYMSPEQLRSEPVDARSDIYSFGVVLYEMSTGKRPHTQTQPISLADAILHQVPSPPGELRGDLTPLFQQIVLKCLEKDAALRYQSVKELLVDLRRLETSSQSTGPYTVQPHVPRRRIDYRKAAWIAGTALVALGIVLAAARFMKNKPASADDNPAAQVRSLVALPSKVYSQSENRFLTDAIPNALTAYLSKVSDVQTMAPPTSIQTQKLGDNPARIAEQYNVDALLSSSVTADADRLILNVQLLDASTQRQIWNRTYEGKRQNYLDLVRQAAEGVQSAIRPGHAPVTPPLYASGNTEAEFAYQRGLYYLRTYSNLKQPADFDFALADLQHAQELEPTDARPAASIARLYMAKVEAGASLSEILPAADLWARRALQLDYRSGVAWQALSVAEEMRPTGDRRKRLEYPLRAATYADQSGYSHHVLSAALFKYSLTLALEASKQGIRVEPLHLNGLLFGAGIYSRLNRPREGLPLIGRALSIEPNMPIGIIMKFWLLLQDHQYAEAEKLMGPLDSMVAERRMHPGVVEFGREWLEFEKSAAVADAPKRSAALAQLVNEARGNSPPFPRWEMITASVLPIQSQYDTESAFMETLLIRAGKGIHEPYDWLLRSRELEQARKDPRFAEVLAPSRSDFQEMLSILEEARRRKELPSYLEEPLAQLRNLR